MSTKTANKELVQLKNLYTTSVFLTDTEGKRIEIKETIDGSKILCTEDEAGTKIAIEERLNGTKIYHVSQDASGLPSSHEIRNDNTEIVYFYNQEGRLEHFVEIKENGDRLSTVLCKTGTVYSIEQKQMGGIVFKAWKGEIEGLVWLHTAGDISTYGDEDVIQNLKKKFSIFLDGV